MRCLLIILLIIAMLRYYPYVFEKSVGISENSSTNNVFWADGFSISINRNYLMLGERWVFDVEGGEIIVKRVEGLGTYPGEVFEIKRIRLGGEFRIAMRGYDYVALNGSQKVVRFSERILDWSIGDFENDGFDEIVVLTESSVYAVDGDLAVMWRADRRDSINRIYVGGGPSSQYNIIVGWVNNSNIVVYYNYTGDYINTTRLSNNPNITDVVHSGIYYYAFVPPHNIFYWTYGSSTSNKLHEASHSHVVRDEGDVGVYEIHNDTISTEIWHLVNSSNPDAGWTVSGMNDYAFFTSGPRIAAYDVDGDLEYEFALWNDTKIVVVDRSGSSAVYDEIIVEGIEDLTLVPGYVVVLRNNRLEYYYFSDLSFSGYSSVTNVRGLTDPYSFIYAYGVYGECYEVFDPTRVYTRYLHAGFRFDFWDDHFIVYNSHRLVEFYPNFSREYFFDGFIESAIVTSSGFVVNWFNDSGCVFMDGKKVWSFPWDIGNPICADYDEGDDKLYIANATGHLFQIRRSIEFNVWMPPLSGSLSPVRICSYSQGYLYAVINYTDVNATLNIFNGSTRVLSKTVSIEVSKTYLEASFVMGDVDDDGRDEYAFSIYLSGDFPGYLAVIGGYYVGVCDEDWTLRYNISGELNSTLESKPSYMVFFFGDSFAIIKDADVFLRIRGIDWGVETHNLTGYEKWASDGIMMSNMEIKAINYQGSATLQFNNPIRCVGQRGKWTRAIVLFDNYTIWNITVSEDNSPPYVNITYPEEGQVVNSSSVQIKWESSDDLGIKDVRIRIDNGEWIVVEGNSYNATDLSEGNHTVYVNVTDIANRTTIVSRSFIVDIPIELVCICEENNTWINRSWINITWETHGPVENISIYANNTLTFSTGTLLNGSYNLSLSDGYWVVAIVASGYEEEVSDTIYVGIDTTRPMLEILAPENNSEVCLEGALIVTVQLSFWDNVGVSHVEYSVNGSSWENVGMCENITLVFASEGHYLIRFRVFDLVGNSNMSTLRIVLDAVARFNVYFPENNSWIRGNNITFSWDSTYIDYIELFINERINKTLSSSGICTIFLGEGIWNLTLVAKGFRDTIRVLLLVKIDNSPPSITVVEPENNSVVETSEKYISILLKLNITDNVGWKRILVRVGNITINTTKTTIEIILPQGTHKIIVEVSDLAGNIARKTLIITVKSVESTPTETQTIIGLNMLLYVLVFASSLIIGIILEKKEFLRRFIGKIRG